MPLSLQTTSNRGLIAAAVAASLCATSGAAAANPAKSLFAPVGSFDVIHGNGSAVAEIVDATSDGRQLVYTDAEKSQIGFVDIANPANPQGAGTVDVVGRPTSLVIRGDWVLVGVDTSAAKTNPSGKLVVVDRNRRSIVAEHDLGGQPDSIALAPDQRRAAIVIENERDEEFNDGLIPQLPSGGLLIASLQGKPQDWVIKPVDLSQVAENAFAGDDLEPEYVDINGQNEAVVSFQENNHFAVIDLVTGQVIKEFTAGSVLLHDIDADEEGLIELNSTTTKRREPDAVAWIDADSFASANEGDYEDGNGEEGGSRGFTVFNQDGTVEHESFASFEHLLVSVGHYNEDRSENKGVEPEAVEYGQYGNRKLLFVGSERSNAVGIYDVSTGEPDLLQVLPTGIGPEGLKAIPQKGLFVASTETAEADAGIPAMINLYALAKGPAAYPMIASAIGVDGLPIPWVALSGLAGDLTNPDLLYAVSDSFLAEGFIYTIDVSTSPATITQRLQVIGASSKVAPSLDLEGIAVGPDGHFWVANEGNADGRSNAVLKVNADTGAVEAEILLPLALEENARSNGFEGVAVTGTAGAEIVYAAIQRAWPAAGDADGENTKIARYQVASETWDFVHYPLQPEGAGDWIGLSEITRLPNGKYAVIERDKGWGPTTGFNAELKALYTVDLATAEFRPFNHPNGLVTINKQLLADVLPELASRSIWTAEKLEGFSVSANGLAYVVTDNDGVDGATGETVFFSLGRIQNLLHAQQH
jgi:Esterase-like activity of phytase